jgi:hypothetical protein
MSFAPQKYELTHFTRARTKFNLQASAKFQGIDKQPASEVRVLGIWLDTKLHWTAHSRKLAQKAAIQIGALTRTTASTWGAAFVRARQIYSSIVCSLLSYGAASWHTPLGQGRKGANRPIAKLQRFQNKCLRTISGAYKATPIASLESETFVPPIDLYLDSRVAAFQRRIQGSPSYEVIQRACKNIQRRLKLKGKAKKTTTLGAI